MPHDPKAHEAKLKGHINHIATLHDGMAKKTALFDNVHDDISETAADMRLLGVTEPQLAPLLSRQKTYEALKPILVAMKLDN